MNILQLSQKRFSARKYTDAPVSDADLDYVLETLRMAPSAVNKQPWKFVVVRSEAARLNLQQCYQRDCSARPHSTSSVCATPQRTGCVAATASPMATSMWPSPPNTCAWQPQNAGWAPVGCATSMWTRCTNCFPMTIMSL